MWLVCLSVIILYRFSGTLSIGKLHKLALYFCTALAVQRKGSNKAQAARLGFSLPIYNIVLSTRTEWNEELEELPPRYEEYKAALANK